MPKLTTMELTQHEVGLIRFIRSLPFGKLVLDIQNSQPVRIERGFESIKLG